MILLTNIFLMLNEKLKCRYGSYTVVTGNGKKFINPNVSSASPLILTSVRSENENEKRGCHVSHILTAFDMGMGHARNVWVVFNRALCLLVPGRKR